MARPSHRSNNQRDNYRPGPEERDRSHERRGRSKSRERRRTPPPRRKQDSWRSPDIRDHERSSATRRDREREISSDSRRSGRPPSSSPHRSSRIEKDRVRSPDAADSRHSRHSHKRHSVSPLSKRRRSISPYSSARKPSKKSKRPRSPPLRPPSPLRRGRPRDSSISPRRALSPRTRKADVRTSTRGSDRSRSPISHSRRRSRSSRSPRHIRQSSTSRYSPPHSHHRTSPKPPTRRYSPHSRRSPETRRRTPPPPRKRRDPHGFSPRNHSSSSTKRRRLSRSPISPLSTATHDTSFKDLRSDREFSSHSSRRNDKETKFSTKEISLRYSKTSSPAISNSPVGNSLHSHRKSTTIGSSKTKTPPQPIPSFESHEDELRYITRELTEQRSGPDNPQPLPEPEAGQNHSPSDYRPPPSFTNAPPLNPDRAARLNRFKGRVWNEIDVGQQNQPPTQPQISRQSQQSSRQEPFHSRSK